MMPQRSLDDRRTARELAEVLENMATAARSGALPPWLVRVISAPIAQCHAICHDHLARQAGAKPLPPDVRNLEDALQELRARAATPKSWWKQLLRRKEGGLR